MTLETYPFLFTINKNQYINTTTILERVSRKPHALFEPHRTSFYMLYLFTSGSGNHMVDFNQFEAKKGYILFISLGQVHAFNPEETYDGRALIFTESFFCRSQREQDYFKNSTLFNNIEQPYFDTGEDYIQLHTLFVSIYDELKKETDKFQGEILHNLLSRIFLISERRLGHQQEFFKKDLRLLQLVTKFKILVEQYFKIHKQVQFYAVQLAVSIRSLQIATAQILGKTPKEWITEQIILEAKRVLVYDKMSVKEVSVMLGFDETTNFIKFFKRNTKFTPSEFRAQF